ncbi:MAG: LysR family transcriptional regulator [bacterium]|nr:LysR family transcriptional regulator [bacterium]
MPESSRSEAPSDRAAAPTAELASPQALRAFLETAERGSFKAASGALGLSPSALSRQIQSLE